MSPLDVVTFAEQQAQLLSPPVPVECWKLVLPLLWQYIAHDATVMEPLQPSFPASSPLVAHWCPFVTTLAVHAAKPHITGYSYSPQPKLVAKPILRLRLVRGKRTRTHTNPTCAQTVVWEQVCAGKEQCTVCAGVVQEKGSNLLLGPQ